MIDVLKSYLKNEDYYLIQTKDSIIIINYNKIITMEDKLLILLIGNQKFKFKGRNFKIIKSIDKSLELKGNIESFEKL